MLNTYCSNILMLELQKADYDGKTVDQGWTWLMEPTVTITNVPSGLLLTPVLTAGTLGPVKANAIAGKIVSILPYIGPSLMSTGVDLGHPATGPFLDALVDGSSVTQVDIDALKALGFKSMTTIAPRRFDARFLPELWPHINSNGLVGDNDAKAITGFPNTIERADFDIAWVAAGRTI